MGFESEVEAADGGVTGAILLKGSLYNVPSQMTSVVGLN